MNTGAVKRPKGHSRPVPMHYTTTLCDLQGNEVEYSDGGDEGARTPDLDSAIVALSQLSYIPWYGR